MPIEQSSVDHRKGCGGGDLAGEVERGGLVGPRLAAELLYTARKLDGADAVRVGLADRLADGTDPVPEPRERHAEAETCAVAPGY